MEKDKELKRLRKKVEKVQDEKRFEHTLGVEFTAAALAMCYDVSIDSARTAGILHDCAKKLSDENMLNICKENNIVMNDFEKKKPSLLHAKVGAFLAKEKYGITENDILNAIRYHTTGREDMSLLEKIIFVADYIEPGRNQAPDLSEIRKLAFEDIDVALVRILGDTLKYLQHTGEDIDPLTSITYEYYKKIIVGRIQI